MTQSLPQRSLKGFLNSSRRVNLQKYGQLLHGFVSPGSLKINSDSLGISNALGRIRGDVRKSLVPRNNSVQPIKEIHSMRDKTESPAPENSEQSLPFFARFLEGQESSKDAFLTLKYPSDRDEIDHVLEYTSGNNGQ